MRPSLPFSAQPPPLQLSKTVPGFWPALPLLRAGVSSPELPELRRNRTASWQASFYAVMGCILVARAHAPRFPGRSGEHRAGAGLELKPDPFERKRSPTGSFVLEATCQVKQRFSDGNGI